MSVKKRLLEYIVVHIESGTIERMKGTSKLSPNIQVWEIAHEGQEIVLVSDILVRGIQKIRDRKGQINIRGNRSISYNNSLDGAWEDSEHIYGEGWDIDCPNCSMEELAQECENVFGHFCNIGIYSTHVHIGVRGFHRRHVY